MANAFSGVERRSFQVGGLTEPRRRENSSTSSRDGFREGRRVGLDGPHGLGIIDLLFAVGTFVEFEVIDGVTLASVLSRPLPPHPLDLHAPAGWTCHNFIHDVAVYKALLEDIRK